MKPRHEWGVYIHVVKHSSDLSGNSSVWAIILYYLNLIKPEKNVAARSTSLTRKFLRLLRTMSCFRIEKKQNQFDSNQYRVYTHAPVAYKSNSGHVLLVLSRCFLLLFCCGLFLCLPFTVKRPQKHTWLCSFFGGVESDWVILSPFCTIVLGLCRGEYVFMPGSWRSTNWSRKWMLHVCSNWTI